MHIEYAKYAKICNIVCNSSSLSSVLFCCSFAAVEVQRSVGNVGVAAASRAAAAGEPLLEPQGETAAAVAAAAAAVGASPAPPGAAAEASGAVLPLLQSSLPQP